MIYQSSFAGYFPADNPQYTCVVVIKNKPHAAIFYGAAVAGPVFKEIADRLYTTYVRQINYAITTPLKPDSNNFSFMGLKQDVRKVIKAVQLNNNDNDANPEAIVSLSGNNKATSINERSMGTSYMPSLRGLGLKDAVVLCEGMGLTVKIKGRGKVTDQSISAGQSIARGQLITVELN